MKTKAIPKVLILTFMLWNGFVEAKMNSTDSVKLTGTALFSFTADYYMLQTDRYIYKIAKQSLAPDLRVIFDSASEQGKRLSLDLPRSSIAYLWPRQPYEQKNDGLKTHNKIASQLVGEAKKNHGQVSLKGNVAYSFLPDSILVQVGDSVYQVSKSALEASQISQLENVGNGARVEINIPEKAVSLVWSYKQNPVRKVASAELGDSASLRGSNLVIKGTVIYSFNQSQVLVQSNDTFYQIQKRFVVTKTPNALDNPGSKVRLFAPIEAVEFAWSTNTKNFEMGRLPAGAP